MLAAAGVRASPESVFRALSAAMFARLAQWDRGAGFDVIPLRRPWILRGLELPARVDLVHAHEAHGLQAAAVWKLVVLVVL